MPFINKEYLLHISKTKMKVGDKFYVIDGAEITSNIVNTTEFEFTKQDKYLLKKYNCITRIINGEINEFFINRLYVNKYERPMRVLCGIFPVWLLIMKDGEEVNEIYGFWSDIAHYVDVGLFYIVHYLTFGEFDRDMFAFFPYEQNGCRWWHQAIICCLLKTKWN